MLALYENDNSSKQENMIKKSLISIVIAFSMLLLITVFFVPSSELDFGEATKIAFADQDLNDKNAADGYADISSVRIAVPAKREDGEKKTREWLEKCGLQSETITSADADISGYDGMVVPGGGDVDPALYGKKTDDRDYGINRKYDEMEIELIRRFAQEGKPVLGICRGCQVINVCFGGTLNQHIDGWHKKNRTVDVLKNSWLYPYMGDMYQTWHYHHQCADKLGEGLIATQWDSNDKVIEAIEHKDFPIYGLQWHPEGMGEFGATVAAAFAEKCVQCRNRSNP